MARKTRLDLKPGSALMRELGKRDNKRKYRVMVISLLRERDGDDCGICGEQIPYDEMSIDHIEEVWRGGSDESDNIRLAHLACNLSRGRGTLAHVDRSHSECGRGHDLNDPANVYVRPNGDRECRKCRNANNCVSKTQRAKGVTSGGRA